MQTEDAYFLLYDGDCRICTAFARIVRFADIRRRIRVQPIQESRGLLDGASKDTILDAAHAVSPDGTVTTGADAMPTLLSALVGAPRMEPWLRSSKGSMFLISRLYGILVEFRGHLSCGFSAPSSAARIPR